MKTIKIISLSILASLAIACDKKDGGGTAAAPVNSSICHGKTMRDINTGAILTCSYPQQYPNQYPNQYNNPYQGYYPQYTQQVRLVWYWYQDQFGYIRYYSMPVYNQYQGYNQWDNSQYSGGYNNGYPQQNGWGAQNNCSGRTLIDLQTNQQVYCP